MNNTSNELRQNCTLWFLEDLVDTRIDFVVVVGIQELQAYLGIRHHLQEQYDIYLHTFL